MKFSHDDRLLLTIGNVMDRKLFIWDTMNGYIVGSTMTKGSVVSACWGGHVRDLKWRNTPSYRFAVAYESDISIWELNAQTGVL